MKSFKFFVLKVRVKNKRPDLDADAAPSECLIGWSTPGRRRRSPWLSPSCSIWQIRRTLPSWRDGWNEKEVAQWSTKATPVANVVSKFKSRVALPSCNKALSLAVPSLMIIFNQSEYIISIYICLWDQFWVRSLAKEKTLISYKNTRVSGCATVVRVVAFDTNWPNFASCHHQFLQRTLIYCNCWKYENNEKRLRIVHFKHVEEDKIKS